jgi:ligand-binding sensor domain-containing protein
MRDGLVLANTYNGAITSSIYNLPSSSVINLLVYNQQIWIGTEDGLGKINTQLKKSEIPNANATVVYTTQN